MKLIKDLFFGFNDAENYKKREYKDLFEQIFLQTNELSKLKDSNIMFVLGEKGTGKTAYAIFVGNTAHNNQNAELKFIRQTEYQKFLSMKKSLHLELSHYVDIWKVIIYVLLAEQISLNKQEAGLIEKFYKFKNIKAAMDQFYQGAFSPEIIQAIRFAEASEDSAKLIAAQIGEIGAKSSKSLSIASTKFQTNLLYIQKSFEDALSSIKLKGHHVLFIDGIDIRPSSVPYPEYLACIQGLADAVWAINNDFLSNIKDSKGRMKVVLLVRPDIFDKLGLQNKNSKVKDNSILLDWITSYPEHRRSPLFMMADRLLSVQQETKYPLGTTWDYYFPFAAQSLISIPSANSSFIEFLRYSLYRPRDIISMLDILKENFIEENRPETDVFSAKDFYSASFTRKYGDYLLGEVKDHLSFYYAPEEYERLIQFFQFLNGKSKFDYEEYLEAYAAFHKHLSSSHVNIPDFLSTQEKFLQFIYDLNIIGYYEEVLEEEKSDALRSSKEKFFHWCFRERTPSNLSPKIKPNVSYQVSYGLMKALDLGKKFKKEYQNKSMSPNPKKYKK